MLQMNPGRHTSGARFLYTYVRGIQGLILADWLFFVILQSVSVLEPSTRTLTDMKENSSWTMEKSRR